MDIFGLTKSKVRSELLRLFFGEPEQAFTVRELAQLGVASAGTVRRELLRLEEARLLTRCDEGNTPRYALNPSYPLYEETRSIVEKLLGVKGAAAKSPRASGKGRRVEKARLRPAAAVETALHEALSGVKSVTLAYATPSSDEAGRKRVGVVVVGASEAKAIMHALRPVQDKLGMRIDCSIYTAEEFARLAQSGRQWFLEQMHGPKTFLIGDKTELETFIVH